MKAKPKFHELADRHLSMSLRQGGHWSIHYMLADRATIRITDLQNPEMVKVQIRGMLANFAKEITSRPARRKAKR